MLPLLGASNLHREHSDLFKATTSSIKQLLGNGKSQPTDAGPAVVYKNQRIELRPNESVLNGLLRSGHAIPHSCQAGACQSCIMQADENSQSALSAHSQAALTPAQRQQGLFLACCTVPEQTLHVSLPDSQTRPVTHATISDIRPLAQRVMQLSLACELRYEAGQFVNVIVDSTRFGRVQRSYSLANAYQTGAGLRLHIKCLDDGQFSHWLTQEAQIGDEVTIEGPHGLCYLTSDDCDNPSMLLAGTGTGLAPLLAILETTLEQEYSGEIHLILANKTAGDFYALELLQSMATQHHNLRLHFLVKKDLEQEDLVQDEFVIDDVKNSSKANNLLVNADVYQYLKQLPLDFSRASVFLCGAESFVEKMRKACFLQGASMKKIKADAFIAS